MEFMLWDVSHYHKIQMTIYGQNNMTKLNSSAKNMIWIFQHIISYQNDAKIKYDKINII